MDSESRSNFAATVDTWDLEVPTEFQHIDDFQSLRNEPPSNQPPTSVPSYENIDWKRLNGYIVPLDNYEKKSIIWNHGWRL